MAQQVPNAAVGFRPEGVYDLGDFDDVSIYSGALSLSLPLGPAYPRNAGRSMQLQLSYLSSAWAHQVDYDHLEDCIYPPEEKCHPAQFQPKHYATAGLGWMVSLGELLPPTQKDPWNPVNGFVYISSDGAEHTFHDTLIAGGIEDAGDSGSTQATRYARDGSFLRFRQITADVDYLVDHPNGDQHLFHNFGTVSAPDYRLTSITDPYGNAVNVTYGAAYDWLEIADGFRTLRIEYDATPGFPHQARRIARVRTARFGSTAWADFTFNYLTASVSPPPGNSYLHYPGPRSVQMLDSVTRPDGTVVDFAYDPATPGLVERVNLPTGGAVEWDWAAIDFPAFRKNRVVDQKPGDEDLFQTSYGVSARRHLDQTGAVLGQWTYTRTHDGTFTVPAEKFTVTSISPLLDKSVYYFSVYPVIYPTGNPAARWGTSVNEFALPYTREYGTEDIIVGDQVQRYLSAEHFDCGAGGGNCVKKRSVYVAYELDDQNTGQDSLGALFNKNRRLRSERTVYHDDGNRWAVKSYSNYDGLGHYRRAQSFANFDAGNGGETFTNYTKTFSQIAPTDRWLLGVYDRVDRIDGDTARQLFSFNGSTGFLDCVRTLAAGTAKQGKDLLVRYTGSSGNVTQERFYGGDRTPIGTAGTCGDGTTPEYTLNHTYASGTRSASTYAGFAWKALDLVIDANTGLPSKSRDAAGVATDYSFDAMARIAWAKPVGATGIAKEAWTRYTYDSVGFPSNVVVERCKSTSAGCTGADRLAESYVDYDALGRVFQEGQRLPGGGYNIRKSLYDAAGNKSQVSTFKASGTGTFSWTTYSDYDAFGRPGTITAPDGKVTSIGYVGVRQVTTTQSIALGLGTGEQPVSRRETMDGQGRLFRVEEYSNPVAPSTYVKTDYDYDEAGRLVRVCQNASGTTCGQERLFDYDNRGFLLSEKHPEKGAAGNGFVYYKTYDSRGHAWRKRDGEDVAGIGELNFEFDGAERLTAVRDSLSQLVKQFIWDSALGSGAGKVWAAKRWNRNALGIYRIDETYEYQGRMGRPSVRRTALNFNGAQEAWQLGYDYDEYGLVGSIDYPFCVGTGCTAGSETPRTVSFTRAEGLLTEIPGWTGTGGITYHPNLMPASIPHVSNRMLETIAKDANNIARPASITVAANGVTEWQSGAYAYDGAGNVKSIGSDLFKHDKVSRTTGSTLGSLAPSRSQNYTFDPYGNLTSAVTDGVTRQIPADLSTNRLSGMVAYDPRGNLTDWNGQIYEHDELNMLRRRCVEPPGEAPFCTGEQWYYIYTADDERVLEVRPGVSEIWTIRGLDNQVLRRDNGNNYTDYIYRDGKLFGSSIPQVSNATRHFALDHLGSVRVITSGQGAVLAEHTYFPFGEEATSASQDAEVMKFAGHQRDLLSTTSDPADDLDYMHARYSNPLTGRFLSVDPLRGSVRAPQSWNRYCYVSGNPLRYSDPSGMSRRNETITVTGEDPCPDAPSGYSCSEWESLADSLERLGSALAALPRQGVAPLRSAYQRRFEDMAVEGAYLAATLDFIALEFLIPESNSSLGIEVGAALLPAGKLAKGLTKSFTYAVKKLGLNPRKASTLLHSIKQSLGRGGKDDLIFDTNTGEIISPETGEVVGNLNDDI